MHALRPSEDSKITHPPPVTTSDSCNAESVFRGCCCVTFNVRHSVSGRNAKWQTSWQSLNAAFAPCTSSICHFWAKRSLIHDICEAKFVLFHFLTLKSPKLSKHLMELNLSEKHGYAHRSHAGVKTSHAAAVMTHHVSTGSIQNRLHPPNKQPNHQWLLLIGRTSGCALLWADLSAFLRVWSCRNDPRLDLSIDGARGRVEWHREANADNCLGPHTHILIRKGPWWTFILSCGFLVEVLSVMIVRQSWKFTDCSKSFSGDELTSRTKTEAHWFTKCEDWNVLSVSGDSEMIHGAEKDRNDHTVCLQGSGILHTDTEGGATGVSGGGAAAPGEMETHNRQLWGHCAPSTWSVGVPSDRSYCKRNSKTHRSWSPIRSKHPSAPPAITAPCSTLQRDREKLLRDQTLHSENLEFMF